LVLPLRPNADLPEAGETDRLEVYQLTLDNSDVEHMAEVISKNLEFTESPEEKEDEWRDAGWMMVWPFAAVLLLWFQRGWVLMCILLVFSSCDTVDTFQDLWYTKDYQGQQLSEEGQHEQAAATYTDPMRQGVAYYKAGDYQKAANAFALDTTAYGSYNQGLAYAEMGDLRSAQAAFDQAIEMDPDFQPAAYNRQKISQIMGEQDEVNLDDAEEETESGEQANNIQNQDMEDLGGGGQEATEEDMQKQRKEETVNTDIRKGKELDEVPDDVSASVQQDNSKVMMQKVDDDPTLFLKRKFEYQLKKRREAGK
jgi:Ca-activated chloride channel family protein